MIRKRRLSLLQVLAIPVFALSAFATVSTIAARPDPVSGEHVVQDAGRPSYPWPYRGPAFLAFAAAAFLSGAFLVVSGLRARDPFDRA